MSSVLILLIEFAFIIDVTLHYRYEDIYSLETCNIPEEISLISQIEFHQRYVQGNNGSMPVVFRRLPMKNYFLDLLNVQQILRRYGNRSITVTSANTYSYKKQSMRIRDYVDLQVKSRRPNRWGK